MPKSREAKMAKGLNGEMQQGNIKTIAFHVAMCNCDILRRMNAMYLTCNLSTCNIATCRHYVMLQIEVQRCNAILQIQCRKCNVVNTQSQINFTNEIFKCDASNSMLQAQCCKCNGAKAMLKMQSYKCNLTNII